MTEDSRTGTLMGDPAGIADQMAQAVNTFTQRIDHITHGLQDGMHHARGVADVARGTSLAAMATAALIGLFAGMAWGRK